GGGEGGAGRDGQDRRGRVGQARAPVAGLVVRPRRPEVEGVVLEIFLDLGGCVGGVGGEDQGDHAGDVGGGGGGAAEPAVLEGVAGDRDIGRPRELGLGAAVAGGPAGAVGAGGVVLPGGRADRDRGLGVGRVGQAALGGAALQVYRPGPAVEVEADALARVLGLDADQVALARRRLEADDLDRILGPALEIG